MEPLLVQVFSFADCPNRELAIKRVRAVLDEERIAAQVTQVEVADVTLAQTLRFLGSPSVRINGVDIEPAAQAADQFGLMCRTYTTPQGVEGAPSSEMIRAAIHAVRSI